MALDAGEAQPGAVADRRPWSMTASCPSRDERDALVVCHIALAGLDLDDLVDDVVDRCGEAEGRRWRHARAEEFAESLVNALHLHISNAELIVHVDAAATDDQVRVLLPDSDDPSEAARRESDVIDRVQAIRRLTWNDWSRALRETVGRLDAL